MSDLAYKTEYWQGREVLPGESMRFLAGGGQAEAPKPLRMAHPKLGSDLTPDLIIERDKAGHPKRVRAPRPHRPTPESYTVADALTQRLGGKRELGKLIDQLMAKTRKPRRRRKS